MKFRHAIHPDKQQKNLTRTPVRLGQAMVGICRAVTRHLAMGPFAFALCLGVAFALFHATPAFAQQRNTVDSGHGFTCAVTDSGGVKCWGNNTNGKLGNGTTTHNPALYGTPGDVVGLTSGVAAVETGEQHACALMSNGDAKCWGQGGNYKLGRGPNTSNASTPVDVTVVSEEIIDIATASQHTCALTSSGGVKCWGSNSFDRLGDDTFTGSTSPNALDVTGLTSGVVDISSGSHSEHTCAIMNTGDLKCWGRNSYGQLGDGTNTTPSAPVDVTGLTGSVVSVALGERHTCALMDTGGVKCWGDYGHGQLGDGSRTAPSYTPVDVVGLSSGVASIDAGPFHNCAVLLSGRVQCWGNDDSGRLGNGSSLSSFTVNVPVEVVLLDDAVGMSLGNDHSCALKSNAILTCWGGAGSGQLGTGEIYTVWYIPPPNTSVDLGGSLSIPASLEIDKSDPTPYPPIAGQPVQYTIWVTNTGSVALTDLTVTDLPSADLAMTAFSSTPSGSCNTGTQRCTLDAPLAPGAVATFDVAFDTGVTAGALISNTVYATAVEAPTAHYPEGPIVTTKSIDGGSSVDLEITKSAGVAQATTGTPFDYTLTVTNNGPEDATNVVATDVLPAGFTFNNASATGGGSCSESGGTVTCTWAALANGANVTATINVTP